MGGPLEPKDDILYEYVQTSLREYKLIIFHLFRLLFIRIQSNISPHIAKVFPNYNTYNSWILCNLSNLNFSEKQYLSHWNFLLALLLIQ